MIAVSLLLGAAVGVGAYLFISALSGDSPAPVRRLARVDVPSWPGRVLVAAGAGLALGAVTRWPVLALAGTGLGWFARDLIGGRATREAAVARSEAVATWAEMLRDSLSAAHGLEQVIVTTAPIAPEPIRPQVMLLAHRVEHHRLAPELRRFADEVADPTADLVVATLLAAAEGSVGKVADVLGGLAEAARDDAAMRRRVDAARARARSTVQIVTGMTVAMMVGLLVVSRGYLEPYGDPLGQAVLAIVAGMFGLGLWWLVRMGRLATPQRFLNPTPVEDT